MPRSFSIDAKPALTENVEHEFRLDRPLWGVEGMLQWGKAKFRSENLLKIGNGRARRAHLGCRELLTDVILDDICDCGRLEVVDIPSSGCMTVLVVYV